MKPFILSLSRGLKKQIGKRRLAQPHLRRLSFERLDPRWALAGDAPETFANSRIDPETLSDAPAKRADNMSVATSDARIQALDVIMAGWTRADLEDPKGRSKRVRDESCIRQNSNPKDKSASEADLDLFWARLDCAIELKNGIA